MVVPVLTRKTDMLFGALILALLGVLLLLRHWNTWPVDLSALYFAAYFYDLGAYDLIYAPDGDVFWSQAHEQWRTLARSQGYGSELIPSFIYPPIWAALLGPAAQSMTFVTFANLVLAIFIGCVVGMIILSYQIGRSIGTTTPAFALWCLLGATLACFTSYFMVALQLGQPQIVVSFLLTLCLFYTIKNSDFSAGAVLALAAAIKLMPALLVVFFVVERRWKALGAFVVVGALLALGSVVIVGWSLHQDLLERISSLGDYVSISRLSIGVETVAFHIGQVIAGEGHWEITTPELVDRPNWLIWVRPVFLLLGSLSLLRATRAYDTGIRLWLRFTLLFLLIVLTSSLAWMHYLILPVLLVPVALCCNLPKYSQAVLLCCLTLSSLPVYVFLIGIGVGGYGEVYFHIALIFVTSAALLTIPRIQHD